jgi:Protein of unknown function (DUF2934)
MEDRAVDQRHIVASLIAKAHRYRDLARWVGDNDQQRISTFAEELKERARTLATPNESQIRIRAWEIWKENGCPFGRDEEFWLQAEREFREAEELAKQI